MLKGVQLHGSVAEEKHCIFARNIDDGKDPIPLIKDDESPAEGSRRATASPAPQDPQSHYSEYSLHSSRCRLLAVSVAEPPRSTKSRQSRRTFGQRISAVPGCRRDERSPVQSAVYETSRLSEAVGVEYGSQVFPY